jgi:heme/copper-type cytochrome/quinol oxidase subunit 2
MMKLLRHFQFQNRVLLMLAAVGLSLTSSSAMAFSFSSFHSAHASPTVRTVVFVIALLLIVAMCAALLINCLAFSRQSAGNSKTPAKPLDLLWVIIPIVMMLVLLQPAVKSIWHSKHMVLSRQTQVHHARRVL